MKAGLKIVVDEEKCIRCQSCYEVCEGRVWVIDEVERRSIPRYPESCILCNACYFNCPVEAISFVFEED